MSLTQQAIDRLGPLYKKFSKNFSSILCVDKCYTYNVRKLFIGFELSHDQSLALFHNFKEIIFKFQENTDHFLTKFRETAILTQFISDARAHHARTFHKVCP